MDPRIFMDGKSDVPQLAGLARRDQGGVGPVFVKDSMRIFETKNFMMLNKIDAIDLQTFERFVELLSRFLFRPAVNLGHDERLRPIAVAQGFAHANFAGALVIVPTIIKKVDPAIDG